MSKIPPPILRSYLLDGYITRRHCLRTARTIAARYPLHVRHRDLTAKTAVGVYSQNRRTFATTPRKLHVAEAAIHLEGAHKSLDNSSESRDGWELTVGVEIHAQLNTKRKLFSDAPSTINDTPNTQVSFFDLAIPGSQPIFQKETLIPAVRAALALNCEIQNESRFDRKHYFHWDQPAGYQITQYYKPFARDGYITLYPQDGIATEDGNEVRVGIKQVQMEQDTAKSTAALEGAQLLDFNRAGVPLIEIITLPHIHHPSTAAALVRKIQQLLESVDACVLGMESGGLRADVNVSVKRMGSDDGAQSYGGITGLGQRTEIKNLSSFKAVRDAIISERDRQISIIEAGGIVEGETRGWTIGSTETTRLRGKEGEVDYRYMPDPDVPPIFIGQDLVEHLKTTLGMMPDEVVRELVDDYDLTLKDAMSLVALDEGGRVEYFYTVVDELSALQGTKSDPKRLGRLCGNWVLHELGGVSKNVTTPDSVLQIDVHCRCSNVPAHKLAKILYFLGDQKITGKAAKQLLVQVHNSGSQDDAKSVEEMIEEGDMWFQPMTNDAYLTLAESVATEVVMDQILRGQKGKIMFLVGQMVRNGEKGRVEPLRAQEAIQKVLKKYKASKKASG